MKVVTAEQIRELDRRATQEFGIPGVALMENAGRAVVEVMQREYGDLRGKRVVILCGTGNNGGDGFVIARHLRGAGAWAMVYLVGSPDTIKGDAKINYNALVKLGYSISDWELFPPNLGIDIFVDALLGTGLKDAPRAPYAQVIQSVNGYGLPVVAVDIPSGVDSNTGATPGQAIYATHTVTFAYPKLGMYFSPGADCLGKLHIAQIGFEGMRLAIETPYAAWTAEESVRFRAEFSFLKRQGEANKGDFGHVAVVAGSRNMAGAPSLVAHGAQRAGAGLVTVLTADSAQPILAAKLNEQMTLPLPEIDGAISEAAFEKIAQFAEKATVLCVGPGMGQHPRTVALIHRIIAEIKKPLVLDADGLNALAQNPDIIEKTLETRDDPRCPLILTPHPGEAGRLLGTSAAEVQSNRLESLRELARKYRAIVVLKGRYTLTGDASGKVAINTSGNPGMATGGSGDTLTGILGGLLSQAFAPDKKSDSAKETPPTFSPLAVTALAVLLHGMAGDIAAEQRGQVGLIAGDIIEALPLAIRRLEETS